MAEPVLKDLGRPRDVDAVRELEEFQPCRANARTVGVLTGVLNAVECQGVGESSDTGSQRLCRWPRDMDTGRRSGLASKFRSFTPIGNWPCGCGL